MNSSLWGMPGLPEKEPPTTGAEPEWAVTVALGSSGALATPAPRAVAVSPVPALPRVPGYEVLGVIGFGGMGIVYKARHRELNRVVALKMLGREWQEDTDSRERFRREAEAVARLQHPNIIQLFDIGTCDREAGQVGQPFMALEYVDSGSLLRFAGTPQDPTFAARMVENLARAAGAAHKVGVIHRDLKPANVLLTADGEPKIADFGLAKQLEPLSDDSGRYHTQAGMVIGTPEYMPPEQVDGKPPTPAVDVYALGVILYELFTGRVPLKGASLTETLLMARLGEPVPPRQLQPTLSRDLDTICLKCLEKQPDKRYATADELADDLARWLDGKTIQARPAGRMERATRWARRNPTAAGWMVAAVLTFAVGLSAVLWKWRDAEASADQANEAAAIERWERYRANTRSAAVSLGLGNSSAVRDSLTDAPTEYRGWEWRVMDTQKDTSARCFRVPELVRARFLSVTGRVLAQCDGDVYRLWDLATGREVAPLLRVADLGKGFSVRVLAPDAALVTVGSDFTVRIVSLVGEPIRTFAGHTKHIDSTHLTADGRRLLTASHDGTVRLWELATGRELATLRYPNNPVIHNATADGSRAMVSTGNRSQFTLWETATGRTTDLPKALPQAGSHFTPDGRWYVTGAEYPDNDLQVMDAATGDLIGRLHGHTNTTTKFAFNDRGTRLVTVSMDGTARLWDLTAVPAARQGGPTGTPLLATLDKHDGWVVTVAFSPDGSRIATGGVDRTVRLWTANGELLATLNGHDGDVQDVAFSSDGRVLYTASAIDGTVRTWDVPAAERWGQLRGHTSFVYDVAFHPDGKRVLSASWDGTAAVWDTATGQRMKQFVHLNRQQPGNKKRVDHVNSLAVHPAGRLAATSSRLNGVWLWDLDAEGESPPPLHRWDIPTDDWRFSRVAFHPAGQWLACSDWHGNVHILDLDTKKDVAVIRAHAEPVEGLAFSPDGRWMATAGARAVRVWRTDTWERAAELLGHNDGVHAVTFSPDGRMLASSSWDRFVGLWDTSTWEQIGRLPHGVRVHSLVFHPKEDRLATAGDDGRIRLWSVRRQQELAALRGHEKYVHALAFSADGQRLVSGSGDATIRVWDTVPVPR